MNAKTKEIKHIKNIYIEHETYRITKTHFQIYSKFVNQIKKLYILVRQKIITVCKWEAYFTELSQAG